MKVLDDVRQWQQLRKQLSGSIGFVPTMGALHDGHASLLRESVARNDITVLSIYVNPTQFNDPQDLANYPDTMEDDLSLARAVGVDYVIRPTYDDLYSDGYRYQVVETEFSKALCGANRPGHFTGVLTVVMKLLNLVRPERAYFGKKDYQQYQLVKDMCETFFVDVEIVACSTVREADGLAMSSRNKLLTPDARLAARHFNKALRTCADDEAVEQWLNDAGFDVDYVETKEGRRFAAVVMDCGERKVRLIDNVQLQPADQSAGETADKVSEVA